MTDMDELPIKIDSVRECRACLVKIDLNSGCIDLFRSWDPPWSGMGLSIADDLAKLAHTEISISDSFSKFICKNCCVRLRYACNFARIVKNTDIILKKRLRDSSKTPSWPKPIQVEKSIATVYGIDVEIKQEILTEDEDTNDSEPCDPRLDIKVEPEEITPASIEVEVNFSGTPHQRLPMNGTQYHNEVTFVDVKDEPMSDEEMESVRSLPTECMLCMKQFNTRRGLKAHVIALHSYDTVTSPRMDRFTCTICKRSFATRTDLCVHETCHSQFVCYVCDEKFDSFIKLTKHRTKECTKDDTLPRVKTLEDVVRPLPDKIASKLQNSPKRTDNPNQDSLQDSPQRTTNLESEKDPESVSREDPNIGPENDTNLETQMYQKSRFQEDPTSVSLNDPNLEPPKEPIQLSVTNDTQSSSNSDKNEPSKDSSVKDTEELSQSLAKTNSEKVESESTKNDDSMQLPVQSPNSDKIELGKDSSVKDTGESSQSSAETNSEKVESKSKSKDDSMQVPVQMSDENDLDQLGPNSNNSIEDHEQMPEKSSSTAEIGSGPENNSEVNTKIEEIFKMNIVHTEKSRFDEETSSDAAIDSNTNTKTEKEPKIYMEIESESNKTNENAQKLQEPRETSPLQDAIQCENICKADDNTQPGFLEFKSTIDESGHYNRNNYCEEIGNAQVITGITQEPIKMSPAIERSKSPEINISKKLSFEMKILSKTKESENKKEEDIAFKSNEIDENDAEGSNKMKDSKIDNNIQDNQSLNKKPTCGFETGVTNPEQITSQNKENQDIENYSLKLENVKRDIHKDNMEIVNRPKDMLEIEKEPNDNSMEVENPQEGMEIQLEIHSIEEEQDVAMDVDSELDSENSEIK